MILASLPKGPANYVQRVGRAGRATGNAYLLTMVDRGPRDRYYLDDPQRMIAGDIRPPGCFLSASEILRRQYLAHLLDRVGAGQLPAQDSDADGAALTPLPVLAADLFGPSAWLSEFQQAALARGAGLVDGFRKLFPPYDEARGTGVSPQAAENLRAYADGGLATALREARVRWEVRRDEMRHRITSIDEALKELVSGDPEHERQGRELRAERRAVARHAGKLSRDTAHSALVDLGLLPNYSLVDTRTELEATLTWREDGKEGRAEHHSKVLRYDRSARLALSDYAPGNHYYVQGYKHRVTGLDIGSPNRPAWLWWRICPDCGYVRTQQARQDATSCPRCRSAAMGDVGCLHKLLVPHRVTARDQRDDVRVRDDTDERERRHYTIVPAVDIPQEHIEASWKHQKATFGWEFTRNAVIRHFNVGASRVDTGTEDAFAGRQERLNPFWVCDVCGYADPDGGPAAARGGQQDAFGTSTASRAAKYQRPWCRRLREGSTDARAAEQGVNLLLAHELRSEALRILIPAVTA